MKAGAGAESVQLLVDGFEGEVEVGDASRAVARRGSVRSRRVQLSVAGGVVVLGACAALGWHRGALRVSKGTTLTQLAATDPVVQADARCSWRGENCHKSKCCRDPAMQCFEQGPGWAECSADCFVGLHPTHFDSGNWSCKTLGPRTPGSAPACAGPGEDCTLANCCVQPGTTCFEKQPGSWAVCKPECTEGVDLTDTNSDPWTCKVLGPTTPVAAKWVQDQCSEDGVDCRDTTCCSQPGSQCYARDEFWTQCKAQCTVGVDLLEPWSDKTWSCDTVGLRTPLPAAQEQSIDTVADWVADYCAKGSDNCLDSKCCTEPGHQCFRKNGDLGQCRASCKVGPDLFDVDGRPWSCEKVGPRTPGQAEIKPPGNVSAWVKRACGKQGGGCMESKCCQDVGMQCYSKNEYWAACLPSCTPGENHTGDPDGKPWECAELGPRTPRPWGSPSLFCFAVVRVDGYEPDLVRDQLAQNSGIFACDEYAVFSSAQYIGSATTYWHPNSDDNIVQPMVSLYLGIGPLGPVNTIAFKPTYVGTSMDHTAGNTQLFLRVWEKVKESGKYLNTDWTLKVDPDAVLFPSRLRSKLMPYNGQNTYIVNCDKPGMSYPMMFGSVEIFSNAAVKSFFAREPDCLSSLGWKAWGEDYFMGQCLDMLGTSRTNMFDLVSDGVCKGVDCGNPNAAAFHPKKDSASWMACLAQAEASR